MALMTVSGRVRAGTDPDLRFAPSGTAVARVRAVASRNKKNDAGEWETTDEMWFSVTAFGPLAEQIAETITKGQEFWLLGEICEETWTTEGGEERKTIKVYANAVNAIPRRDQPARVGGAGGGGGGAQQYAGGGGAGSAPGDPWGAPSNQPEEPPF